VTNGIVLLINGSTMPQTTPTGGSIAIKFLAAASTKNPCATIINNMIIMVIRSWATQTIKRNTVAARMTSSLITERNKKCKTQYEK